MLKVLRHLVGLSLMFGLLFQDMRSAAPQDAGVAGTSMRGPGAHIRARLDRASALTQAGVAGALDEIDDLLSELQARRSSTDDPLSDETREALAREAIGLRNQVVLARAGLGNSKQAAFITQVAAGAAWSDWSLGVPASITIAQAVLESNWGRSAPAFNLFGLKGEGPAGHLRRSVVEYKNGRRHVRMANFRAYPSVEDALVDHASILAKSRHYVRARAVGENIPAYAAALQGTYATDPRYAGKLTGLIARYGLDRFDWNARSPWM